MRENKLTSIPFSRSSLYSGVPTDAQLTLYLLRQRELASQPLPRPPAAPTAAEAEAHLNDTSPMAEAHDESTIESVGDGDGTHLVGDGQHADAGASSNKVKSKVVALGQKIASKGATFHNKGKIEVLPAQLNGGKAPKRSMKARLSNFILNRATLDDKGSIWAYPASLNGTVGHIIIDNDEGDPITESQIAFLPKGASEPSREFSVSNLSPNSFIIVYPSGLTLTSLSSWTDLRHCRDEEGRRWSPPVRPRLGRRSRAWRDGSRASYQARRRSH